MYLVSIEIKLINSDDTEEFSSFNVYRVVNTTGMYNEDYIIYKTKDFSELNYNLNIDITPEMNITDIDLTPTDDFISAPDLQSRLVSVSSMYSVSGGISFDINDNNNSFGRVVYSNNIVGETPVKEEDGLCINISDNLNDDLVMSNDCIYLGTTPTLKGELESEMVKKYDPKEEGDEDSGEDDVVLSSLDEFKISKDLSFKINGEVRRGIYFPSTTDKKEAVDCFVMVPAVSDVSEFNNYVSCRTMGFPNNMKNEVDNNETNLYPAGIVGVLSADSAFRTAVLDNKVNTYIETSDGLKEGIPGHP